jgi:hypothetical protein
MAIHGRIAGGRGEGGSQGPGRRGDRDELAPPERIGAPIIVRVT